MINLKYIEQLKKELKYDECYDYLMSFIEKEDPEAYYIYATWCDKGEVVDPDMEESIKYYKLAVNQGHELALKRLAEYFYELGNYCIQYAMEHIEKDTLEDKNIALRLFKGAKTKYSLAMNYGHLDACDKYFEVFDLLDEYNVR